MTNTAKRIPVLEASLRIVLNLINTFIFNINIFEAANTFYLKKYMNIHITLAFEQTLLALKICSTLYVHYKFPL